MLMQNFGVTNKEHYGMLWYFWSGQFVVACQKKTSFRKFRAGTAKKSDRKACVILHVQSRQSNVLLVKTQGLNFAKAP